jgi:bla regulator protein BlaR1
MILYCLKVMFCSGILLAIYLLFLERETMHRFNRFYLLGSLLFSLVVPLITIPLAPETVLPIIDNNDLPDVHFNTVSSAQVTKGTTSTFDWTYLVWRIYLIVAAGLLIRFVYNIYHLLARARANEVIKFEGIRVVVVNENLVAHSFFNTVFISRADWLNHTNQPEVLAHEKAHLQQKHSFDILFIELLRIVFWFNPLLFFYKRAIQLNHEFLADEAVVHHYHNVHSYQQLLLDKLSQQASRALSSQFNFLLTKKRLQMMNKVSNNRIVVFKQLALVPVLASLCLLFSEKLLAQGNTDTAVKPPVVTQVYGKGVSQALIDEYETAIKNARGAKKIAKGKVYTIFNVSKLNRNRMDSIYFAMSKEQREKATVIRGFIPTPPPPSKRSPSTSQLNEWADAKMYGVWLDGQRVNNAVLTQYKPSDIALYSVGRLEKNAINYGKHYYQVDLMTPAYYDLSYKNRKD